MIDPAFLDELDALDDARSRRAHTRRRGERSSTATGEGLTFSDFRRYTPGDEPRLVDWNLYARTEELYVKQYEEERQATVHVLLDASASMDFGVGHAHKFEYGAKIGLGAAYRTAREHDEFQFSVFGRYVDRLDDQRSSRGEVLRLIDRLNDRDPDGETRFDEALPAYADRIGSKALVVVVSDFLADPDDLAVALGALADNRLIAAHVIAPEERDPATNGDTIVEDPESGDSLRTYFGRRTVDRYRDALDAHLGDVAATCDRVGARHVPVTTGDPFVDSFVDVWPV